MDNPLVLGILIAIIIAVIIITIKSGIYDGMNKVWLIGDVVFSLIVIILLTIILIDKL